MIVVGIAFVIQKGKGKRKGKGKKEKGKRKGKRGRMLFALR